MSTSCIDANDNSDLAKPGGRTTSPRAKLLVGLLLLSVLSLANLFYRIDSLPAEVSLRIECAKLITQGQIPYVQFFVLDAPLPLLLACVPVKLADLLRLDSGYAIASCALVFEWIVSLLSLALSAALLLRRNELANALWCHSMLLTLAVLNIACVFQFGQTEHFLMLGMIPYMVARWLEYSGRKLQFWEALLCGLVGGFAIMLDPCFWMAPVTLELTFASHFRRFPLRIVTALTIMASTAVGIRSAIYSFGSEMMRGYHAYILPLLTADRGAFDMTIYGFNACPDSRYFIYLLILATLLAFGIRRRRSIVTPLIASGWLGFAYNIIGKGFFFQALPMFWCASLAIAILGTSLIFDLRHFCPPSFSKYIRPFPVVISLVFATVCTSLFIEQYQQHLANTASVRDKDLWNRKIEDVLTTMVGTSRRHDKIMVLSNMVAPLYPTATLKERTPGSRIMWSFHFPILEAMKRQGGDKASIDERERLVKFYNKILLEDITKNRPRLIFSDQTDAASAINGTELEKLILKHYMRGEYEALFYSDNLPPREFSGLHFPLWVDQFSM